MKKIKIHKEHRINKRYFNVMLQDLIETITSRDNDQYGSINCSVTKLKNYEKIFLDDEDLFIKEKIKFEILTKLTECLVKIYNRPIFLHG